MRRPRLPRTKLPRHKSNLGEDKSQDQTLQAARSQACGEERRDPGAAEPHSRGPECHDRSLLTSPDRPHGNMQAPIRGKKNRS